MLFLCCWVIGTRSKLRSLIRRLHYVLELISRVSDP